MIDHLSETEVNLFRERTIGPAERERIDSHVAQCDSCLRRILPSEDTALVYSELTEALLPDSADEPFHLSNAEVRRYANGSIDQAERTGERLPQHPGSRGQDKHDPGQHLAARGATEGP